MLNKIKLALRKTANTFDDQITDCIEFVKKDLVDLGAELYSEEDPKIIHLTELYCKSVFDYDGKGDWYLTQYERLRDQMTMQGDYRNGL